MTDLNETRIIPMKDRNIVVKQLKDIQLLLMSRDAELLGRDNVEPRQKLRAAGFIMDTFESAIVTEADREYVLGLARSGEIELEDMLVVLSAFREEEAPVKPVVRRGRPRKATQ